jgi:hypothetical protein
MSLLTHHERSGSLRGKLTDFILSAFQTRYEQDNIASSEKTN